MSIYRRARIPGGSYFFTAALEDRSSSLLVDRIDALRQAFASTLSERPFRIDAIVILPDHLHCIWTLPEGDSDFSSRWQRIKGRFSRACPSGEQISTSRGRKRERGIWHRRYWEHVLRDERDFATHVDYIHFNPVRHGHAGRVADWLHSSFHRYVRQGTLPRDWGGEVEPGIASAVEGYGERGM
jgi:putative transposase